ncbi:hypothetical protein KY320_01470 [Candidatus Woesearchaeota archaeon]|nr:hypothetical protein [Candidatus Woesearchaeota archaeon]
MKIKEVEIRAKQSYNYNTYEVGMIAEIENNSEVDGVVQDLQRKCRELVEKQVKIDSDKTDELLK